MSNPPLLDRFADPALISTLLSKLLVQPARTLRFMEVCGTHTMAIFQSGLRSPLADKGIELLSGPGCPVCVTAQEDIDLALYIASDPQVTFCTFGDMMRVPGTVHSLSDLKAEGADVRVVYSPLDALTLARQDPRRRVVFLAIGFETTVPAIASTVLEAVQEQLTNFFILPAHKTIPEAMLLLAKHPELQLDGFICPGHVSVIIGEQAYQPVVEQGKAPCVITGFEPLDILRGIGGLVRQVEEQTARVENAYSRVVKPEGNPQAQSMIQLVFAPATVKWRGLGAIEHSGLALKPEYQQFDIRQFYREFSPPPPDPRQSKCRCGEVLLGKIKPPECALFGKGCTPDEPLGACMVSQEGSCQAYYRYRHWEGANAGQ